MEPSTFISNPYAYNLAINISCGRQLKAFERSVDSARNIRP